MRSVFGIAGTEDQKGLQTRFGGIVIAQGAGRDNRHHNHDRRRACGHSRFATGGIGGVHRGAERTMDISADLEELAQTDVLVVCAGAKSILDLGLTLEYLETHGVPVIGYGTDELPAFFTRSSGFAVDYRMDTPEEVASAFLMKERAGLRGGMVVANPIPEEFPWIQNLSTRE